MLLEAPEHAAAAEPHSRAEALPVGAARSELARRDLRHQGDAGEQQHANSRPHDGSLPRPGFVPAGATYTDAGGALKSRRAGAMRWGLEQPVAHRCRSWNGSIGSGSHTAAVSISARSAMTATRSRALRPLARDLWVADRPLKLAVGDIGARMTVIRLADGSLFLHSPVRLDDETRSALDELGPVRAVVAPSKVHHLFAGDYGRAYPGARLYGAPGLAEKRRDLRIDALLDDEPPAGWRGVIDQRRFLGAPALNEVIFLHASSRTLVLTDLAFNVPAERTAGARMFYWLTGAAGRFGPHRLVRLMIRDRRAARASVERVLAWNFERVIVSHGDVLETGGRERFAAAFAFL
jgi:hypothetical protein